MINMYAAVGCISLVIFAMTGIFFISVSGVTWYTFVDSFVSLFPDVISGALYLGFAMGIFTCVLCVPGLYLCYKMVQDAIKKEVDAK